MPLWADVDNDCLKFLWTVRVVIRMAIVGARQQADWNIFGILMYVRCEHEEHM